MGINFGGFLPLSTLDWRGRCVCVVFFRGCPNKCWYCHNKHIRDDYDIKSDDEIMEMINSSKLLISGVVFSGGEPTMQSSIIPLAERVKHAGYGLAIHTSGIAPDNLETLIERGLLDKVSLDIKTSWGNNHDTYNRLLEGKVGYHVSKSLKLCQYHYREGNLKEFEVVTTLFNGINTDDVFKIKRYLDKNTKWVLNQGITPGHYVMTSNDLKQLADKLKRKVYIRTREDGEFEYVPKKV